MDVVDLVLYIFHIYEIICEHISPQKCALMCCVFSTEDVAGRSGRDKEKESGRGHAEEGSRSAGGERQEELCTGPLQPWVTYTVCVCVVCTQRKEAAQQAARDKKSSALDPSNRESLIQRVCV